MVSENFAHFCDLFLKISNKKFIKRREAKYEAKTEKIKKIEEGGHGMRALYATPTPLHLHNVAHLRRNFMNPLFG